MKSQIEQIFRDHPKADELYIDARGNIWTERTTAEAQSRGAKITIVKREKSKPPKKN